MKFSYKFSNLFGTVYRGGDLVFSNDGNTVISPVGNKVSPIQKVHHYNNIYYPVDSLRSEESQVRDFTSGVAV